ncbi:MAG: molecular chaperone DnaJ, partial [bacterium]|nr:molecular chaperone DnaJ [bacterium]
MAKRDYYEVLGIEKNATESEIKKAYRRQAMKNHPDRNPEDAEADARFKESAEAFEVLGDPQKRQVYDQYGHQGLGGPFQGGGFQWSDFTHASDFQDIFSNLDDVFGGSIFGDLFGGRQGGGRRGPQAGEDLRISLKLTMEEIAEGAQKKIKLTRMEACGTCSGSGAKGESGTTTCSVCKGMGQVRQASRSLFGQFVNVTTCPQCQGEGKVVREPCPDCRGEGRVKKAANLTVNVPAGVSDGNYIPLRGQGSVGRRGGPAGDCMVFMEEAEHDLFERHGNDILFELPVSFSQAALGAEVKVPTLNGKAEMKVPPGTQSGQ